MVKATLNIVEDETQVVAITAEIDNFDQLNKIKAELKKFFSDEEEKQTPVAPAMAMPEPTPYKG